MGNAVVKGYKGGLNIPPVSRVIKFRNNEIKKTQEC